MSDRCIVETITSITIKHICKDCGWPVITACCKDSFTKFKDSIKWDWWIYCSNKGCKNHEGKGIFQNNPEWVIYKDKYKTKCWKYSQ
jgi:hypothetical protein